MRKKTKAPARRQNVTSCSHDPETGQLTVTFHDGRRYNYAGVPADLALEMRDSPSLGSFLNSRIIGKYEASRFSD